MPVAGFPSTVSYTARGSRPVDPACLLRCLNFCFGFFAWNKRLRAGGEVVEPSKNRGRAEFYFQKVCKAKKGGIYQRAPPESWYLESENSMRKIISFAIGGRYFSWSFLTKKKAPKGKQRVETFGDDTSVLRGRFFMFNLQVASSQLLTVLPPFACNHDC